MWAALLAPALAQDCAEPLSTIGLQGLLDDAREALEQLDSTGFQAATDALSEGLPCVDEVLNRPLAAEIHRTRGIRAVGDRDPHAAGMFAAARSIEPAYKFPSSLIPSGNPVRLEYGAFDLASGTFEVLPRPGEGSIRLDGRPATHRPAQWPSIAQYVGADGGVRWTRYLFPEEALPPYPIASEVPEPAPIGLLPTPVPPPDPLPPPVQPSARGPMIAAGVGGLILSGGLYGLAGIAEAQFKDPSTSDDQLDGLRARANGLSIASGFVAVASVGVGVAGIATPPTVPLAP